MGKLFGVIAASLFVLHAQAAQAYSLTEHRRITAQAIAEFNFCFGDLLDGPVSESLQKAVRNEDLNLIRKWALFSHFYNPNKKLEDMSRLDGSYRVAAVQEEVRRRLATGTLADRGWAFYELGHAIHHIQDMASPPHVVPVMHGLVDGYETWELPLSEYPERHVSHEYCESLRKLGKVGGLYQIFRETAFESLDNLKDRILVQYASKPLHLDWSWFWEESPDPAFGSYGKLGNSFGKTFWYFSDGATLEIPSVRYREFKRRQIALAIDRTVEALTWFF